MLSYEEMKKFPKLSKELFDYLGRHGFSKSKSLLLVALYKEAFDVMANPDYSRDTMLKLHTLYVYRVMPEKDRLIEATLIILEN